MIAKLKDSRNNWYILKNLSQSNLIWGICNKKCNINKVTVYEEYLMYDLVAMIGAIGGTLGLCIGISLKDMTRVLLRFLEQLRKKVQRQVGNRKKRLSKDILVDKKNPAE